MGDNSLNLPDRQFPLEPLQEVFHAHCLQLFDSSGDGLAIIHNKAFLAVNAKMADLYGATVSELLALPVQDVFPRIDVSAEEISMEPRADQRTDLISSSGDAIRVSMEIFPFSYQSKPGVLVRIRTVGQDPTLADEIQKVKKLESIAALSGGIAHDYNNLLTVIIGNISLIQSYIDESDILHKMLNEAFDASIMAKSLTQKLITFSKGGDPMKETADLAPLVKSAVEFSLSGSNIKAEFEMAEDLLLVEIDPSQIGQAIYNIVINARDSMPEGGTLVVKAMNIDVPDTTDLRQKGKYVSVSITDQGTGISAQNLEKVFDPYFSTKERGSQKGMGLDLSICHSIIEKHSGWIDITSEKNIGTTVSVSLPASEKKTPAEPPAREAAEETLIFGKGRILVMDDEEMIIKLANLILNRLGYDAAFATHGQEALDLYKAAQADRAPFDAVILDLTIRGGMGGKETIEKLIEFDPEVKCIVSSGYSESPVLTNYTEYGFKGKVVKPYSLFELSDTLHKVIHT